MERIIIKSPAKINFGLNIIEKRSDGYHNIETIFYPISLCDVLTFERNEKLIFTSNDTKLQNDKDNLILKTVRLLEKVTAKKINLSIHLDKNIPIGAGLGGGSSNAAHTLLSINELLSLRIKDETLKEFALMLGSDVPFFLKPFPSFAERRGEILTQIDFHIKKFILLVNPGIHVSTKWAYQNIKPKKPSFKLSSMKNFMIKNFSFLKDKVVNDFEEIVFADYPEIKIIKETLYKLGAEFSLMSGSGSTIFAIFNEKETVESAHSFFSKKYFTYMESPE